MGKKKHQRDPNNEDETSESGDENQNNAECSHINKSLDFNKIRKYLTKSSLLSDCEECQNSPIDPDLADFELDLSLWMCLKCGNQACGRMKNRHALKHYSTPHSDSHSLCINTTNWSIWCYDCDDEVNATAKKKLVDVVDYLKKHRKTKVNQEASIIDKAIDVALTLPIISPTTGTVPKVPTPIGGGLPRARGLTNLGNTCFFNSVMQCLGQTPYLLKLLQDTKNSQSFRLPGGQLKIKDKEEITLEPLEGETERWRPIMQTLAETLGELQNGRNEVYNPRNLLQKLGSRMPQFGSGEQHDSHELLRHLLEAVREEDQKRFKAVILEKLGYSRKTDPSTVDNEKKQIVKFYGQQVSDMLLATEQVFRGVLVSTLQCQVCQYVSHRDEYFLDLSLPISEKQVAPILRRKADELEDNKPSKHQIKKEKRAERKKNISMEKSDSEESDADIEDNTEDSCNNVILLPPPEDFLPKAPESGYNSDKIENSSPDSNNHRMNSPNRMNPSDSGVPSPTVPSQKNIPCISPNSPENSPASSETNVDMGSPLLGNNTEDDEYGIGNSSFQRPMSRLAFVGDNKNVDIKADLEKLSLLNDGDSAKINSCDNNCGQNIAGACVPEPAEMMDQDDDDYEDIKEYSGTLASRYQCEEGECSVESCLNQFTECELMMGTNKVGCDMCTKRSNEVPKKTVYRDASKQLLIYNPPAVLILHLKRFQVYRFRSTKVNKFVKFSTSLDLGPFCSKRAQSLPSFVPDQKKVLYSLYGVVEHSGSIHGGHYVSYIKVRPQLDENSPRWNFIPKNQKEKIKELEGAQGNVEPPSGKWYYISDSYVSDVSESKVLSAQAYLLFYERLS
ncbi:ubiquitin specific protease 16/45 isoform X2 [Rhynchophorus ferrugineus]|uniref:Ubiquitin carboxyl-terminal hydrolase n=1 Tax=Rhynchophorus ferrugineus TaxID=354439 RepID=A0A834HRA5_RHYFE|nr:hypothetical protein GWI33_020082 [Rhynchophorus ferrugineus]